MEDPEKYFDELLAAIQDKSGKNGEKLDFKDIETYIDQMDKGEEKWEEVEFEDMDESLNEEILKEIQAIQDSPNHCAVDSIKTMLAVNSMPFYASFGNKDDVRINIDAIVENPQFPAKDFDVSFKLAPEKYLKGIILTVPKCKGEFDAAYFAIVFYAHKCDYYTCEYISGNKYCLRKNEGKLITFFDEKPSIDEIWAVILSQYEVCTKDGVYMAWRCTNHGEEMNYVLFDVNDSKLMSYIFGSDYRRLGVDYANSTESSTGYFVYHSMENDNIVVLRNNQGEPASIEESDMKNDRAIMKEFYELFKI